MGGATTVAELEAKLAEAGHPIEAAAPVTFRRRRPIQKDPAYLRLMSRPGPLRRRNRIRGS